MKFQIKKLEYRISSVARVLDYMSDLSFSKKEIPNHLIVHCLNKLHGNIDGIELSFDKED